MGFRLTPLQQRLAAVGLLLILLGAIVGAVAFPGWWLNKRYDDYLSDYTDRVERYLRVAAFRSDIEKAVVDIEKRDSRQFYLKGASSGLAAAELQGLVTQVIETHGGRVVSSQIQQAKDDAKPKGVAKVTISVQLNAPIVPLQLILHAIESHQPYFFVDQFSVRANQGRGYKPVPGGQPEFAVQLTISAYIPIEGVEK